MAEQFFPFDAFPLVPPLPPSPSSRLLPRHLSIAIISQLRAEPRGTRVFRATLPSPQDQRWTREFPALAYHVVALDRSRVHTRSNASIIFIAGLPSSDCERSVFTARAILPRISARNCFPLLAVSLSCYDLIPKSFSHTVLLKILRKEIEELFLTSVRRLGI